jgi:hypothetical protein
MQRMDGHPAGRRAVNQGRLFLVLLGAGSLSIIAGRMVEWLFWPLGLMVPVCCILGYGYLNWRFRYAGGSRQQVADNAYFLGFLYFLVSLSVTLLLLTAERIVVLEVVKGFGTALVTSIVGLAARILILQGSDDFDSARNRAEADYVDAVRQFTRDLRVSTELLTSARVTFIDQMREVAQATGRQLHEIAGSVRASVEDATQEMLGRLRGVDLAADVSGMDRSIKAIEAGLARAGQVMGKAVDQLEETAGAAAKAANVAGEAAKAGAEMVRSLVSQLGHVQDAAVRIGSVTASMQRTASTAVAIEDSIRRLSLSSQFTALNEQVARHANVLSEMAKSAGEYAASARKAHELEESVRDAARLLAETQVKLEHETTGFLASFLAVVNGIQQLLETGASGQQQIIDSLAVLKTIDQGVRQLEEDMKHIAGASRRRRGMLDLFSRPR